MTNTEGSDSKDFKAVTINIKRQKEDGTWDELQDVVPQFVAENLFMDLFEWKDRYYVKPDKYDEFLISEKKLNTKP